MGVLIFYVIDWDDAIGNVILIYIYIIYIYICIFERSINFAVNSTVNFA